MYFLRVHVKSILDDKVVCIYYALPEVEDNQGLMQLSWVGRGGQLFTTTIYDDVILEYCLYMNTCEMVSHNRPLVVVVVVVIIFIRLLCDQCKLIAINLKIISFSSREHECVLYSPYMELLFTLYIAIRSCQVGH